MNLASVKLPWGGSLILAYLSNGASKKLVVTNPKYSTNHHQVSIDILNDLDTNCGLKIDKIPTDNLMLL
jgi:hypothetical protein